MNIVVLDGQTLNPGDNPWTELERLGPLKVYPRTSPDQVVSRAKDADIVLTNKVELDQEILSQLPRLKFIAVTATGYNIVDVKAAAAKGIPVSNVPVYSTPSVAQHVFTGLLALLNRPEAHDAAIREGAWQRSGHFSFWQSPLSELSGKTCGIVGLGKIGREVARIANAFGMRVVATSRSRSNPLDLEGFEWMDLESLFACSEVVTLHCPQTAENIEVVDRRLLSRMKPTAVLVNTARGGLVNERDLAEALDTGVLAGAFLDVLSSEPPHPDNPLLNAQNCLLTPHVGWATIEARGRLMQTTVQNVAAFLQGSPLHQV